MRWTFKRRTHRVYRVDRGVTMNSIPLRNRATKQYCHTLDWMIPMTYIHYETLESPMHDHRTLQRFARRWSELWAFHGTVRTDANFASHKLCHRIHRTFYFIFNINNSTFDTSLFDAVHDATIHLPQLPPSVCVCRNMYLVEIKCNAFNCLTFVAERLWAMWTIHRLLCSRRHQFSAHVCSAIVIWLRLPLLLSAMRRNRFYQVF